MEGGFVNGPTLAKHFARKWKERHQKSIALPIGEAAAFFKRQLDAGAAPEEILALMDFFFNRFSDPFVLRCGHSLGSLRATYPALVAAYAAEQAKSKAGSVADENFRRLEEARRGVSE